MKHLLPLTLLLGLSCFGGCTHAEFDVLEPPELAQHVGTDRTTYLGMPPLEYWLVAYEDHLIVRIYNRSESPIQLVAAQSVAIDPRGQSRPVPAPNAVILPGTFVKLILPPVGPRLVPVGWGPSYGYGWGYRPYWYPPPPAYVVYTDDGFNWSWPNGGDVRLILVYAPQPPPPAPQNPLTRPSDEPPAQFTPPAGTGTFALPAGPPPGTFTHQLVFRRKNV